MRGCLCADLPYQRSDFGALKHWDADNHADALSAFLSTADILADSTPQMRPVWQDIIAAAKSTADARQFFETHFSTCFDHTQARGAFHWIF